MTDYMKLVQYASQLDKTYGTDSYNLLLEDIKRKGYKVLRNSQGKHKLKERNYSFGNNFDEIFGNIFGGLYK